MTKNTRAFVRVTPRNADHKFGSAVRKFGFDYKKTVEDIEKQGLVIIKNNTPKATGNTANSWTSSSQIVSGNATIKYTNPLPQARFLNTGTRPSPGRYVPVLDRRIRTGTHPGIQGTKYIDRSGNEITNVAREKITKLFIEFRTTVKQKFRI